MQQDILRSIKIVGPIFDEIGMSAGFEPIFSSMLYSSCKYSHLRGRLGFAVIAVLYLAPTCSLSCGSLLLCRTGRSTRRTLADGTERDARPRSALFPALNHAQCIAKCIPHQSTSVGTSSHHYRLVCTTKLVRTRTYLASARALTRIVDLIFCIHVFARSHNRSTM